MIKVLVFDFDGVILESTLVKTNAFRKMFTHYPDKVDEIVDYHVENGGISRFRKFEHIYNQILMKPLTDQKSQELGKQFTDFALDSVLKCPYVPGAEEFLKKYREKYLFFIASGTPDSELKQIISQREMGSFFDGVYGSPRTKNEIVEEIMRKEDLSPKEMIFIGDAHSDRIAANETNVPFIFRVHKNDFYDDRDQWHCYDLTQLDHLIQEIEQDIQRGE